VDLRRLKSYVRLRKEDLKADLKWELCLNSTEQHIEFATDVASIANSRSVDNDPNGYLILGVPDANAQNVPPHKPSCAPFGDRNEVHTFNQRIQQFVNLYCDPPVSVEYREYHIESSLVGLITIYPPRVLPVFIHNTRRPETDWVVWVRSGMGHPGKRRAKSSEIRQFFLDYLRTLNPHMLDEEWKRYKSRIKSLLHSSKADRIATLVTELVQAHVDRRAVACQALGEITGVDEDAKKLIGQLLIGFLYDEEPSVQWEAIRALQQLKDERAIAPLRALCREVSQELAVEIVNAIQAIGGGTAVVALRSILDEASDDEVQEYAEAALAELIR